MASFILFTTSDFGSLVADYIFKNHTVKAVVTSTPKPKGRHFSVDDIQTVKNAKSFNIPVIYIDKSKEIYEKIKDIEVDYILVVDFAFILKKEVLDHPLKYAINLHPSLLPKYRGPSPLQFQLIDNIKKTGVSIIKMDESIDQGDILFQLAIELDCWYIFSDFYKYMQELSLLTFEIFIENSMHLNPIPQDNSLATYTRKIEKKDAFIDFKNEDTEKVIGKIKAFEKWPKVKIKVDEEILILLDARKFENYNNIVNNIGNRIDPAKISISDIDIIIGTKDGAISIEKIQKIGKSAQNRINFLKGYRKRFINKEFTSGV